MTDVPALAFVDPNEVDDTYRVCLWAAPGQGKSVAAASAPGPIIVLTADRPSAYKFARKHWRAVEALAAAQHALDPTVPLRPAAEIRELRYVDASTLTAVYRYLGSDVGKEIRTLVVDPMSNIIDSLRAVAPRRDDGDLDHEWVNNKVVGFVQSLRRFDVNVVLVAHERLNDGTKGDGKLYPALGGPTLINKLLAELDIAAHIERVVREGGEGEDDEAVWIGQLQPRNNLICKESTGSLGDRRVADLSRWFAVATEALAPDESDIPWSDDFDPEAEEVKPSGDDDAAVAGPQEDVEPPTAPLPSDGPTELPSLEEAHALVEEARLAAEARDVTDAADRAMSS